jgi:hypothetical protein
MAAREVRRGSGINGSWAGWPARKGAGSFQAAGECIKAESTGSNSVIEGSYAASQSGLRPAEAATEGAVAPVPRSGSPAPILPNL